MGLRRKVKVVSNRKVDESGDVMRMRFKQDIVPVIFNGPQAQEQFCGDIWAIQSPADQFENFRFSS